MDNPANVDNLDQFGVKMFEQFLDCVDSGMLMRNILNDRLIWLDFLANTKVRLVLTAALTHYKNSDLTPNIAKINEVISESFINETGFNPSDIMKVFTLSAISSLQLYVIDNFVHFIDTEVNKTYGDCLVFVQDLFQLDELKELGIASIEYSLDVDGETIGPVVRNSDLLKLSRIILTNLITNSMGFENDIEKMHLLVWSLRCAIIHQISLKCVTSSLYEEISQYTEQIVRLLEQDGQLEKFNKPLRMDLLNEIVNTLLWYGDIEKCRRHFAELQELAEVKFQLTGCMGVRTRFQEKALPQLMVSVDRADQDRPDEPPGNSHSKVDLPKNEPLEDDTMLPDVQFVADSGDTSIGRVELSHLEQCLLLTSIKYSYRFGSSSDQLLREELLAYIGFLLAHSTVWPVQFVLLELRSMFEKSKRRQVERSMKQIETLTNCVRECKCRLRPEQVLRRIESFYSTLPSPFWTVERHLADLLASLGVFKSALDYYIRLQSWDDVILCYRQIGRPDKAEEIVRQKLKQDGQNQPDMLCLLGELTGDICHYEQSWQVSQHKYARAPKMLGLHYFRVKDYGKALECFRKSIEANSIQTDVWYRVGFICLEKQDWKQAAEAYRRVLQFDSESYEAWNNLSKAYIHAGDHRRAWFTLQEAIKCNFDEWKIWENYLLICASVAAYSDMIQAWNRLIDLKEKYTDDQLAHVLASAVIGDVPDVEKVPSGRLLARTVSLFARITSTSKASFTVWRLYARLLLANRENEPSKITRCLQRCQRELLSDGWTNGVDSSLRVLQGALDLCADYLDCGQRFAEQRRPLFSSLRLWLQSVLSGAAQAKKNLELTNNEPNDQLDSLLARVESQHEHLVQSLTS